jgi:hypothetical protein
VVIIKPVVVIPSVGVEIPVNVGVVDVSIIRIPIDVAAVNVTPVDVAAVKVAPVDVGSIKIAPVDVSMAEAGRSVSDSGSAAATASPDSTASPASGLRYAQPHATRNQQDESYDNLSHGSLLY